MAYEFKLPDLGEGLTEGEIARWLVTEGQELAEDDPLVEIATDKTTVEIPSPAAGTVTRILVAEGEVVPVGTVLVVIGGDGATEPAAVAQPRSAAAPRPQRRQSSRRISTSSRAGDPGRPPRRPGAGRRSGSAERHGAERPHHRGGRPQRRRSRSLCLKQHKPSEGRREPVRGVRRQIVEHLTRAHREIPAVTFVEECGLHRRRPSSCCCRWLLKATAASLQEFPELNARLEGDEIVYLERYDLGVAVQTDQGLVVPVVRACDTALAGRARGRGRRGSPSPRAPER